MNVPPQAALWSILTAIRESSSYPELLLRIARVTAECVPSDRATIYVLSRRRNLFVPAADHGTPPEVVVEFVQRHFGTENFPGADQLAQGRLVHAVRRRCEPAMERLLELARLSELLTVPLMYQGETEGMLSCGLHGAASFSERQKELLAQLAPHLALLVRTSRLEAEHARLAARRTQIARWGAEVLGADELDAMAARLCAATRALFLSTRSTLLLLQDGVLVPCAVAGSGPDGGALPVPIEPGSFWEGVLARGEPLVLNELKKRPERHVFFGQPLQPAAVLVMPLRDPSGPLGVLIASDTRKTLRFAPGDLDDACLLATIAGTAVRKGILLDALRRASAAKSEFLASVSHELRTPLNVLLGYTQLLRDGRFGEVNEDQADTLDRIERAAQGQLALINDLLDLASIEHGKLSYRLEAFPLLRLLPALQETMDALLRDRPVRFEAVVPPDAVVQSDATRLLQVLVNLLGNAAKFTQRGRVRLRAFRMADTVQIVVDDTGPGMDLTLREQALEPFVRGESDAAGSGLGLAIVSRLLSVLGGSLSIDTSPDGGTAVRVDLPAAAAAEAAATSERKEPLTRGALRAPFAPI